VRSKALKNNIVFVVISLKFYRFVGPKAITYRQLIVVSGSCLYLRIEHALYLFKREEGIGVARITVAIMLARSRVSRLI
jgi:hypothetical protein